jgi:hypothetical protein
MMMMRKAGFTIPPITCNFISARTFHEAKKLVLLAVSQYGKVDKKGLHEFVGDDDFDIEDFDLPGDGDETIWDAEDEEKQIPIIKTAEERYVDGLKKHTCPECDHQWHEKK